MNTPTESPRDLKQLRRLLGGIDDEHRILAGQLKCLREATESLLANGGRRSEEHLEVLHRVDHFFRTELVPHLSTEEGHLFPLLRELKPSLAAELVELEQEHGSLRELLESFGGQLALLRYVIDAERDALLFRLVRTCWEIWSTLRRHAEREQSAVDACAAEFLK